MCARAEDIAGESAVQTSQTIAVEVVGRRQSGAYHEDAAHGATKSDIPWIEVPQAVRVVPRQLIDDLGALRVDELLDYVAGASRQNNFGGTWDNIALRGFAGHEDTGMSLLRNGMASNRGFNAPRDTANVERVEFLKGTMGALYGNSEPGGSLNVMTKRPRFTWGHSFETYYGSHDYKRVAVDSTGPLDEADGRQPSLAYRINASAEDKGSFREHVRSRRELLAPALAWKLSADTMLRYDGEWLRQRAPLDRGIVAVGGRLDAVPISRFYGEPGDGAITIENQTHQLFIEHTIIPDWQLRAGLQHKRGNLDGLASEGHQYGPDPCPTSVDTLGWLCRRLRQRNYSSRETGVQLEIAGKGSLGGLEHEALFGMEGYRFSMSQKLMQQSAKNRFSYGIDVVTPVYGASRPPLSVAAIDRDVKDRSSAIYAQDQISLSSKLKLLLGIRHDSYHGDIDDRTAKHTTQGPEATSPRIGITWLGSPDWSLYASVGRSFRPQVNTDATGRTLEPETGTAREVGVKWQSPDGRLGGSVALFDIAKRNVARLDADGIYLVPLPGTVHNKGLEAELAGWLTPQWRIALSYAYLDADPTITQFARNSGSVFISREMTVPGLGRVGAGGGFTHVGSRAGDTGEPRLPAYTIGKMTAYWNVSPHLRLSFDVDNVFNRTYYISAYNRVWITPGSPRQVTAGLQYRF
ncbi:MAG TPA: TonB-dependent receptor [Burkholderiaceae bacterium]|nr:TonB-dependent receptor [Burkholderiaceae bacterium]